MVGIAPVGMPVSVVASIVSPDAHAGTAVHHRWRSHDHGRPHHHRRGVDHRRRGIRIKLKGEPLE
jgi:hypothetical protein